MNDSVKDKYLAQPQYHAERAYESIKGDLLLLERRYQTLQLSEVFSFMAMDHERLGLLAYFARGDMEAFKQHWSLASKLYLHAARHLPVKDYYMSGGEVHLTLESSLLCPLVSDNRAVIDEVAALETPVHLMYRDNPKAAEFAFHLAQLVIRNDYEAAHAKIEKGARKAGGNLKKAYAAGTDFYSLLMKGDKAALEASIMDTTKRKRTGCLPVLFDFIYPGATFRTKLCWYKGIPVEIEHPMVPKEWMPVAPLPHYDDVYDFLSPDWTPPDQGLFARLARKFRTNYPTVDACLERIRRIDAPTCPPGTPETSAGRKVVS